MIREGMDNQLPALRYPELTPQGAVAKIGHISGEAYQHVGRYAGAVVLACFEQIGGMERMATWADSNPTDFYTKLMPKLIQRSAQVDVSGTVTIDDAISRLESQVPEADYREVEDAQFFDL
jgi:hypothetical protein